MAKSRKTSSRKRAARSPRRAPRRAPRAGGVIQLKPIYVQIGRRLEQLRGIPDPNQLVKDAIDRLQECQVQIGNICSPTMEVPHP